MPEGQARRCDFKGLDMEGLDLTGASLIDANFEGANLQGVVRRSATPRVYRPAPSLGSISRVNLGPSCAAIIQVFEHAKLAGANFRDATVDVAVFDEADLESAWFGEASHSHRCQTVKRP